MRKSRRLCALQLLVARPAGLEPATRGLEGDIKALAGVSSSLQIGGTSRDSLTGNFQPSQPLASNRKHFAASLLHGTGLETHALRSIEGGKSKLLSVKEAASRLGVCTATVYSLCERGELAHIRVLNAVRIAPSDLAAFVRAHRTSGASRRGR